MTVLLIIAFLTGMITALFPIAAIREWRQQQ